MVKEKKLKRKKKKFNLFDIFNVLLMLCLSFIFLYPFWETAVMSFSDAKYANTLGLKFWPMDFSLDAYEYVFAQRSIWIGYKNTIWRTVVGTVCTVTVTYCTGYAMTKKATPGLKYITFFMVFTMFFGGGMIPSFLTNKAYGLVGSRWALILPGLTSCYNIMVARNYIKGLPGELEEAAVMDGAHPLQILFGIMAPLSKPIIAVMSLWSAVGQWNSWFDAMIYLNGDDGVVLQTVIRRLIIETQSDFQSLAELTASVNTTPQTVKSATILFAILPIICVYPFIQKYFVKGVTIGAVKG